MDIPTFRVVFPELADPTAVPDGLIQFNIDLAADSLLPEIWGARLDAGIGYYAAHYVALALQRAAAATRLVASGQTPGLAGLTQGVTTSKSAGPLSTSKDVSIGQTLGGGSFNLTSYGQAYLTLRESVAGGVMQF